MSGRGPSSLPGNLAEVNEDSAARLRAEVQERMRGVAPEQEDEELELEFEEEERFRRRRFNAEEDEGAATRYGFEETFCTMKDIDMSVERGRLNPQALYSPHRSITDHRLVYVLRSDAHVQIVDNNGENIFDKRTSAQPMKSPLAGYTSVLCALPVEVIENAYQMSPREAMEVKFNREHQTFLLSPSRQGGGVGH
ncbi:hypothetical protein MLD38_028052 [Melastoma candidum]|uniref:Uncharacterized protein n=1 Tax=Melastoma candidum TaxID=119954 RepID=A0ACB9N1G2_9MYRT|nr:hypothetical protein MLD38_028052 [Melastoma candidum]